MVPIVPINQPSHSSLLLTNEPGNEGSDDGETINARYLLACDGAHSWARDQLGVATEGTSEGSTWGIFEIVPITDFRMLPSP